jgi:HSP20 family protein
MAKENKKSFFERLTGTIKIDDERDIEEEEDTSYNLPHERTAHKHQEWLADEPSVGELPVDVYQTPTHILVKTIVAGVRPDDLDISISRDMVTVKGHREEVKEVSEADYFHKELYWGSFSRTIMLPEEIEVEEAEAAAKDGMLTIKLPKINKQKQAKLKVRMG